MTFQLFPEMRGGKSTWVSKKRSGILARSAVYKYRAVANTTARVQFVTKNTRENFLFPFFRSRSPKTPARSISLSGPPFIRKTSDINTKSGEVADLAERRRLGFRLVGSDRII